MAVVGQAVDDGNGAVFGQILHLLLGKGTDHDAVQIAAQHPGGVLHRLAAADLQVPAAQKQREAAQIEHTHFEGYTGTGRGFGENHAQSFAFQQGMRHPVFLFVLQLIRNVQQLGDLIRGQIGQFQ